MWRDTIGPMRLALVLLWLSGCDVVFRIDKRDPPGDAVAAVDVASDALDSCVHDEFAGTTIDQKWEPFNEDARIRLLQAERLIIDFSGATNLPVNAEAGVTLYTRYDMTSARVDVEVPLVVTSSTYNVENYMIVRVDRDNFYVIRAAGNELGFWTRKLGVDTHHQDRVYQAGLHRYWRIANEPDPGQVTFATSSDRIDWFVQAQVPAEVPFGNIEIGLIGGSFNGGDPNPGTAIFDNFQLCGATRV